jgi:hypothetical protein
VFAHQAAKASWASAVIIFGLAAFGGAAQREFVGARVLIELVALFLMVVGLALGVVAWFGIRKHGTRGILAPAVVGIILNGLLLFIFVTNFFAARARSRKHTGLTIVPLAAMSQMLATLPRSPIGNAPAWWGQSVTLRQLAKFR